jgi:hypothetical protein
MSIHDQLGHSQDFSAQVEGISESRFLSLLSCKSLNWFQIEVEVQMEVVEILPVNKQVEHVVALPYYL